MTDDTIKNINIYSFISPVKEYKWSPLSYFVMTNTLVEIITENGIKGYGATYRFSPFGMDISIAENTRHFAQLLLGKTCDNIQDLCTELRKYKFAQGMKTISILDIALWDMHAKSKNKPLYKLFTNKDVYKYPAYASTQIYPNIDAYAEHVHELVNSGYNSVKFHVEGSAKYHVETCTAMRQAFPNIELILDSDSLYDLDDSIFVAKALEKLDYAWLEAPMPDGQIDDYATLKKHTDMKIIAGGNTFLNLPEIEMAYEKNTVDALRADTSIHGGVTSCLNIVELAKKYDIDVEFQSWGWNVNLLANLHTMAGFDNTGRLEIPVPKDGFSFATNDGINIDANSCVDVPQEAGLGCEIDMDAIMSTNPVVIRL